MDCVFSQCCEQVLSGAGEGWGVFVLFHKEQEGVYAAGQKDTLLAAWLFL